MATDPSRLGYSPQLPQPVREAQRNSLEYIDQHVVIEGAGSLLTGVRRASGHGQASPQCRLPGPKAAIREDSQGAHRCCKPSVI